ncbi:tRNA (adenosine(37)-N6)-threonylcarbamoyltransferase complex transferase subunit TsaD [Patescibacteria group bacterium]|nr:tRNA (adenosine(37)-N6)-threonylcarbamoyltransferase complex transferase subunit TsaD [Patescibacteria group bacterium]
MLILGIETSCDDTSVALIECRPPSPRQKLGYSRVKILSSVVSSQTKVHAPYGGVVPNLAARAHLKNIKPVFDQALKQAGLSADEAGRPNFDLIAVTVGPGLIPALLVGVNFAKALAYAFKKPLIGVNHLEGHLYANWINNPAIKLPALCLIVSGGHTQLVLMTGRGKYQLLGETRDDAAGEAFDKVAKLLGLGYPGGPVISKRAEKGNKSAFDLPRPMIGASSPDDEFDFSFSGLKTAVLYQVKKEKKLSQNYINNMAASFQQAVIDVLMAKTAKAAKKYNAKSVMISGGVAANSDLRKEIREKIKEMKIDFYAPELEFCTDNAAMIAAAVCFGPRLRRGKNKKAQSNGWAKIRTDANLRLENRT